MNLEEREEASELTSIYWRFIDKLFHSDTDFTTGAVIDRKLKGTFAFKYPCRRSESTKIDRQFLQVNFSKSFRWRTDMRMTGKYQKEGGLIVELVCAQRNSVVSTGCTVYGIVRMHNLR
mgnify:CR=1 FL=1